MVQLLQSLWTMVVWFNLTWLADAAMVEILHLNKCILLIQQWIRVTVLLWTRRNWLENEIKSDFMTFEGSNNNMEKKPVLIDVLQYVCSLPHYNIWDWGGWRAWCNINTGKMRRKCMMGNFGNTGDFTSLPHYRGRQKHNYILIFLFFFFLHLLDLDFFLH